MSQKHYVDTLGDTQTPYTDSATAYDVRSVYNNPDSISLSRVLHFYVEMLDTMPMDYFSLSIIDKREFRFAIIEGDEFSYERTVIAVEIESLEFYSWTCPLRKGWRGYIDIVPMYHSTNPTVTYYLERVYSIDGTIIGENSPTNSMTFENFPSQIISVTACLVDSSVVLINCGDIKFSRTFDFKIISSSDPAMKGLTVPIQTGDCPLERYGPNYFVTGKTYVLRIKREWVNTPPFVHYEFAD